MISQRMSFVLVAVFTLLTVAISLGAVPQTINYQGRLTDELGEPITATVAMTFTIYDAESGGNSKWSETHASVSVVDGLFDVILGSVVPLPDSVFTGDDRYLGIMVGVDPEISPRTPLTSASSAFYARRITGDVQTDEGSLTVNDDMGNPAIMLVTESGPDLTGVKLYSKEPTPEELVELKVTNDGGGWGSEMTMYLAGQPGQTLMKKVGMPSGESSFKMFNPDPVSPDELLGFKVTNDGSGWGSEMAMYLAGHPGQALMKKVGMPSGESSFKMFNPQPEQPIEMLEMDVTESLGFWESRLALYNHDGGPEGKKTFEVKSTSEATDLKIFDYAAPDPYSSNAAIGSYDGIGLVWLGQGSNLASALPYISGKSTSTFSDFTIKGGTLTKSDGPVIYMETDATTARVGVGVSDPVENIVIGKNIGARDGNRLMIGDDTPGVSTGVVVGQDGSNRGWLLWSVDDNIFSLGTEQQGGLYGGTLTLDSGRVGINNTDPRERLSIGDNLGSQSGDLISIGNASNSTGVMFGEDSENMGRIIWQSTYNRMYFMPRDGGHTYNTMTIEQDRVGIMDIDPSFELDVDGDIQCIALHETSDARLKSDVAQLEDALGTLSRINGVSFEWNQLAESHGGTAGKRDVGVIADELERVLPELVYTDNEGYKSVSYTKLVPVLIEAVKELESKTARIERLESQVEELTSLVKQIVKNQH